MLIPGAYIDKRDKSLHLFLPELLAAHGYADTPENREVLTKAAREMLSTRETATIIIEED